MARSIKNRVFGSDVPDSLKQKIQLRQAVSKTKKAKSKIKTKEWQDIYRQTIALRQHNYDTLFNKEKLSAEVNKTLISFLEFFDSSQVSS